MKKVTPTHDLSWYIKWVSTILLLAAGFMAAINIIPENFLVGFVGLIGWTVVGALWHDRSIIILHVVSAVFALTAYLNYVQVT